MSVMVYNRGESQAKQSVAYLQEILCAMKSRGIKSLRIKLDENDLYTLESPRGISKFDHPVLLRVAHNCIPEFIKECLPITPKTIDIFIDQRRQLKENKILTRTAEYGIFVPSSLINDIEYLEVPDNDVLFSLYYKACTNLIQCSRDLKRSILIDASKRGIYTFKYTFDDIGAVRSSEFGEGFRSNNPVYSAFNQDLPHLVRLNSNIMHLQILMGSGKISRLKFHYMNGGDLIQFC